MGVIHFDPLDAPRFMRFEEYNGTGVTHHLVEMHNIQTDVLDTNSIPSFGQVYVAKDLTQVRDMKCSTHQNKLTLPKNQSNDSKGRFVERSYEVRFPGTFGSHEELDGTSGLGFATSNNRPHPKGSCPTKGTVERTSQFWGAPLTPIRAG
jgi:hypothetical protein